MDGPDCWQFNQVKTHSSMDREGLIDMHGNEVVIPCNKMSTPIQQIWAPHTERNPTGCFQATDCKRV